MIIIPHNISFDLWANQLFIDMPALNIPIANQFVDWKDWGRRLIEENQLVSVPLPNNFDDWRIWAEYFIQTV